MGRSHRARSTNQRPLDGRVIGHMEDHRVGRGLDLGHDHPCPAEAAVNSAPPIVSRNVVARESKWAGSKWSPRRSVIAIGRSSPPTGRDRVTGKKR